MRSLVIPIVVLLVVGGGAGYWYLHASGGNGIVYRTEPVAHGDLMATISASGTVEPEDVVDVGAQVAGMIEEFGVDPETKRVVDYGSPVKPSSVLARIDDRLYKAKVEQSRAQLLSAKARLESAKARLVSAQAKVDSAKASTRYAEANLQQVKSRDWQSARDWERAKKLGPTNVIAPVDFDTAKSTFEGNRAAVAVAEASLNQARANEADAEAGVGDAKAAVGDAEASVATATAALHQDEINLGYCTITSPIEGTVIDRRVTIGQTVQSSFNTPSLFLLAKDLKRMTVWASVNEADINQVHIGQKVRFTVDAEPNETFYGTVRLIRLNATNTQNVVTYTVEVSTDNSNGKLKPYMTANLQFEVDRRENVLLVSNAALRYRPAPEQMTPEARQAALQKQKLKGQDGSGGGPAPAVPPPEKERHKHGTVWVEDGALLRPIKVRLGLSDGNMTEAVDGKIEDGTAVIVGESRAVAGSDDGANPFAPKMFGGKKKQ
jgi:HlyD family secretion protein